MLNSLGMNARLTALRERNSLMNSVISELSQANKVDLKRNHLLSSAASSSSNIFIQLQQHQHMQEQWSGDKENRNDLNVGNAVSSFEDKIKNGSYDISKVRSSIQNTHSEENLEDLRQQNQILENLCQQQQDFLQSITNESLILQWANTQWSETIQELNNLLEEEESSPVEEIKQNFCFGAHKLKEIIIQNSYDCDDSKMDIEQEKPYQKEEEEHKKRMKQILKKKEKIKEEILQQKQLRIAKQQEIQKHASSNKQQVDSQADIRIMKFENQGEKKKLFIEKISQLEELVDTKKRLRVICWMKNENKDKKKKTKSEENIKFDSAIYSNRGIHLEIMNLMTAAAIISQQTDVNIIITGERLIEDNFNNFILQINRVIIDQILELADLFQTLSNGKYQVKVCCSLLEVLNEKQKDLSTGFDIEKKFQQLIDIEIESKKQIISFLKSVLKSKNNHSHLVIQFKIIIEYLDQQKENSCIHYNLVYIQQQLSESKQQISTSHKQNQDSYSSYYKEHNRIITAFTDILQQSDNKKYSSFNISSLTTFLQPYFSKNSKTLLALIVDSNQSYECESTLSFAQKIYKKMN